MTLPAIILALLSGLFFTLVPEILAHIHAMANLDTKVMIAWMKS